MTRAIRGAPTPHPGGLGAICPSPGAGEERDRPDSTSCTSDPRGAGLSRPRPPEPPKLLSPVAPPLGPERAVH